MTTGPNSGQDQINPELSLSLDEKGDRVTKKPFQQARSISAIAQVRRALCNSDRQPESQALGHAAEARQIKGKIATLANQFRVDISELCVFSTTSIGHRQNLFHRRGKMKSKLVKRERHDCNDR
jgi:hypothetical protein